MSRSKIYFTRDLRTLHPEDHPEWVTSSLTELGEEAFAALMLEASQGDPFDVSTPESAIADLRELRHAAADAFDADRWVVVSDNAGVIGVVLPQPYPQNSAQGTLFYLGVIPDRRGYGLGKQLHHYGLQQLMCAGVTEYKGSTDAETPQCEPFSLRTGASFNPLLAHQGLSIVK